MNGPGRFLDNNGAPGRWQTTSIIDNVRSRSSVFCAAATRTGVAEKLSFSFFFFFSAVSATITAIEKYHRPRNRSPLSDIRKARRVTSPVWSVILFRTNSVRRLFSYRKRNEPKQRTSAPPFRVVFVDKLWKRRFKRFSDRFRNSTSLRSSAADNIFLISNVQTFPHFSFKTVTVYKTVTRISIIF